MATTRSFSAMLNDFLANDLLKEEMVKRDYILSKVEKDDTWVGAVGSATNGGALIVPFKAAGASSVSYGSLTGSTDISEDVYVRGQINVQPEMWGTMVFNHRDIMEHNKVSEKNFLKLLPESLDDFMQNLKFVVSGNLLNGNWIAKATAVATGNDGLVTVDRPDRFSIGQKVMVGAGPTAAYVKTINMNTRELLINTTRAGSTPYNFSGDNLAVGSKIYNDGAQTAAACFTSLRQIFLSSANGGDSTIYGVTKTAYPYTQAINIDGSTATAANLVEKIFDGFTATRKFGKGAPTDILMSYTNFGYVMKIIEASKGAYNVAVGSQKASQYGWTEITVGSVTSQSLKFVAVQEMDDDVIMYIDWRALKFYSNGFFQKRKSPDGSEYFEVRATTGYSYIVDICLFGDLVCNRPSYCGIMYGISIP